MCKALENVMEEKADEIYVKMKGDYTRVLGGGQLQSEQVAFLPKAERALRTEVMSILKSVDAEFEPIARGELQQEAGADGPETHADEHTVMDENDEGAFESARESLGNNVDDDDDDDDDFVMGGMEDATNTESTPSKHLAVGILDDNNACEKGNRALATPNSDDTYEKEEM
jgi:hypothetical protein